MLRTLRACELTRYATVLLCDKVNLLDLTVQRVGVSYVNLSLVVLLRRYYALANNLTGAWLDRGRCPSDDLGEDPLPEDLASCAVAWQQLFVGSATVMVSSGLLFMALGSADSIDHRLFPAEDTQSLATGLSAAATGTRDSTSSSERPREPTRPPPVARMRVSGHPPAQHGRAGLTASGYVSLGGSE